MCAIFLDGATVHLYTSNVTTGGDMSDETKHVDVSYRALKLLNATENPIKDRVVWWNDVSSALCMHHAVSGALLQVEDNDKKETCVLFLDTLCM